jgi:rubrerythrin
MSATVSNSPWAIEELDVDGAIREGEDAVAGDTRAEFFRKAAIGGGALIGGGAVMSAMTGTAQAAIRTSVKGDIAILNFALTLEYLEAAFYAEALQKMNLIDRNGAGVKGFVELVAKHENTHVKALQATIPKLGGKPVKKPRFDFRDTNTDFDKFVATAIVLEDTGVRAYGGQAPRVHLPAVLAAAASILTVEARHAAWIRYIAGQTPAPLAFDTAWSKETVLKAVGKTGFIVG